MRVIAPGGGELIGDTPARRLEILAEHDGLHATWARIGPRREGAGLHVHRDHTDIFYVLDGELTVRLGVEDEAVAVGPGTFARVPPMVVHGFANRSAADTFYLNFHAPGLGFADYLRGLVAGEQVSYDQEPPPASGVRPASEAAIGEPAIDIDAIAITVGRVEPGPAPAGSLYVLEGTLALEHVTAPAGSWVDVDAPAVVTAGARCLSLRTPGAAVRGARRVN